MPSDAATPKIAIRSLGLTYRTKAKSNVEAIRDVTLDINRNEFIALIGPSGCGKSSLLNILAGFVEPTTGSALIDGQPIAGPGDDRGYVFQEFALFPWKTVQQNVEFGLKMRGVAPAERRQTAQRYLALVGLSGFAGAYPRELSGGMRQRVAIARAYAPDPDILLMDEPFGNLDALSRGTMQLELRNLWRRNRKTVLMVTHSVDEAIALADRVVVMTRRPSTTRTIVTVTGEVEEDDHGQRVQSSNFFIELKRQVLEMAREELSAQNSASSQEHNRAS